VQDGRSLRVSVRRGVGAAAQEVPEHLQAASPRCGVHGAVHHLAPEFLTDDRAGRRVEEPAAVPGPEEAVAGAGAAGVAVEEEAAGDGGAVPGGAREARVVVPDGLEAADAAEGGELDEEVGVEAEELADEVVVAAGRRPVDGRRVPPLVARALPPQRQERLRRPRPRLHG